MKDIIFLGRTGSGKTTLSQKLNDLEIKYKKTQTIEKYQNSIDTPGEYMENRHFYSSLITTAADAEIVAVLADSTKKQNFIPPGFSAVFCRNVIGIITKISISDEKSILAAEQELKRAGITKIFKIDTLTEQGLTELFDYIENHRRCKSDKAAYKCRN